MLTDQQTLRAAFEPLNGENIHVHLVCAQKQSEGKKPDNGIGKLTSQSQTPPASTIGVGNQPSPSRVVTGSTIPNVNHQQMPFVNPSLVPGINPSLFPGMFPMFGAVPGGAIPGGAIPGGAVAPMMWTPEQMAHMQQMYTQFLAQYNLQPNVAAVAPASLPLAFPQLLNANIHANEPPPVPPVVPGVGVGGDQAPPNPMRLEADDDDDENRDWLDLFYWLSRAVVLFSVVYFYSSFTRFILVVGIAILMYLHQIGFIFPGNNRPPAPRQLARPAPENRQDRDSDNESDGNEEPVTGQSVPEATTSDTGTSDTERCSGLRLFWVIVSSLFTSLIPETQAPVNFN